MPGRRTVGSLAAVALGIGSGSLAAAPVAHSQAGDGAVTVRVIRAVDNTGVWTPALEPGIAGVRVTLTDDAGAGIEGVTAADGTVTLTPAADGPGGGRYRVQVVNPKPGVLFPAFASRQGLDGAPNRLSSNEEFVDLSDGKNVAYTTGLWNPGDYCQKNAPLVTTCQPATREGGTQRTLVSFPYDARGQDGVDVNVTDIATDAETGTLFGIAWNKADKRVFSSALAKRTTDYGPGGAGGIYVTDRAQKATTLFTVVPDAGTTAHGQGTDDAFLTAPGKESLGGIKITDDGKDLFVVNLNNRKLYRYDATVATAAAPEAVAAIPDPGCPAAEDWRPFGLGLHDGVGYVGGVCSGESTGKLSDLRAVVMPFDLGTGAFRKPVLDQPLDYPRQSTVGSGPCDGAGWYPWTSTYPDSQNGRPCGSSTIANPEPELGEIDFESDGSMLLAFRDRFGDRAPAGPTPGSVAVVMSGGDLNKACQADGTYVMDTNNGCGLSPGAPVSSTPAGVVTATRRSPAWRSPRSRTPSRSPPSTPTTPLSGTARRSSSATARRTRSSACASTRRVLWPRSARAPRWATWRCSATRPRSRSATGSGTTPSARASRTRASARSWARPSTCTTSRASSWGRP